jgi:hypothetical protein
MMAPPASPVPSRRRPGLATATATFIVAVSIVVPADPAAQVISSLGLILLPGMVLTSLIIPSGLSGPRKLLVSTGVGLTMFCLVGAAAGAFGPSLGVGHPLGRMPLVLLWLVILAAAGVVAILRRLEPIGEALAGLHRHDYWWIAALAVPPCVALCGATRLNANGSNAVAIVATVLGLGLILTAVALGDRVSGAAHSGLFASGVVTLIWQLPTRGGWLWGWDIQHEFSVASATVTSGRFPLPHIQDPYAGMLSLTVLPAQLHFLNGMQLRTILVLLPGVMLAGCAVTTLVTARRIAGSVYAAFLVALLIVGTASFLLELPALMRQSVALFLFTLLIQLVADPPARIRRVRVLVVVIGAGVAVSHYSSAYLTAGAVLTAWLLGVVLRADRARRVLTASATAGIVGVALVWGLFVAHTASYLGQVARAIRRSGLELLPGSGSLLARWLKGASTGKSISPSQIHALDVTARAHRYSWMTVDPRAGGIRLANISTPGSHGVPILGPIVQDVTIAAREAILLFIVLAVLWGIWRLIRRREHVEIVGLALFGGFAAAVSRTSGTLTLQFNTDRVEAQMYLIFVVIAAYLVHNLRARIWRIRPFLLGVLAALQVALAFGIGAYAVANSSLPVALSSTGPAIQQLAVTPSDRDAAGWAIEFAGNRVLQADPYSSLALDDFGAADRKNTIATVNPVVVDNGAWVLATSANVTDHTARAIIGSSSGSFVFPRGYFIRTRAILYVSRTDVVFGADPS